MHVLADVGKRTLQPQAQTTLLPSIVKREAELSSAQKAARTLALIIECECQKNH